MPICYLADASELMEWQKQRPGSPWESLHSQAPTEEMRQEQVPVRGVSWNSFTKTDTRMPSSEQGLRGSVKQA